MVVGSLGVLAAEDWKAVVCFGLHSLCDRQRHKALDAELLEGTLLLELHLRHLFEHGHVVVQLGTDVLLLFLPSCCVVEMVASVQ